MRWIAAAAAAAVGLVSLGISGYLLVVNHRRSRLFDQLVDEYEDLDRAHAALKAHVKSLGTTVFTDKELN